MLREMDGVVDFGELDDGAGDAWEKEFVPLVEAGSEVRVLTCPGPHPLADVGELLGKLWQLNGLKELALALFEDLATAGAGTDDFAWARGHADVFGQNEVFNGLDV